MSRRSASLGIVGVACLAALALAPASAHAGDAREESRAAFLRGVGEAHKNHFTAARDAFLEAYRLFPHPSILLNLAVARMHTGEYVAAEENLSRFLVDDGGASSDDLANARATLAVVRKHLGTIRIRVSPDGARGTLDGAPLALTPGAFVEVRAVVGPSELRVEAKGRASVVRQIVVDHDDNAPIDLTLAPLAPGATEDGTVAAGSGRHTLLGWSLVGGAGAAAIVGTVAGFEAIGLAHDYNTAGNPHYQDPSTRSEGVTWRTSSDVFFAMAIATGAAGAYFLLVPIGAHGAQAVVGPTQAALRWRF